MEKRVITFYLKNTEPINIIDESEQTTQELQVEIKRLFTTKQIIMFDNEKEFLIVRPSDLITVKVSPYVEDTNPLETLFSGLGNMGAPDETKIETSNEITITDDNLTTGKITKKNKDKKS